MRPQSERYELPKDKSTKPETVWFLSETYDGRLLKLVYIPYPEKQLAVLRTTYEPEDNEVDIWNENL